MSVDQAGWHAEHFYGDADDQWSGTPIGPFSNWCAEREFSLEEDTGVQEAIQQIKEGSLSATEIFFECFDGKKDGSFEMF